MQENILKKFLIVFLIITILCVPVSFASSSKGDYSLPSVVKNINITDDGTAIISENITYSISGTVNGVYRDVSISGEQRLDNISVETPGYYNTLEVTNESGKTRLKVWLYKDAAKTQKVSDEKVDVIYHYNFIKGVKIYNDVAEFQYMAWGSDWDKGVDMLTTYVQLPGSHEGTQLWNNPQSVVNESTWISNNTLKTVYNSLSSSQNAEQRILMPKTYFKSTKNADVINKDAKSVIEEQQADYEKSTKTKNTIADVLSTILALLLFVPGLVYFVYGREPKITYKAKYESQLPTNHSPIYINSIVNGNIGEINNEGFQATLLNLIDNGYYKIISTTEEDIIIRATNKDISNLDQYEVDVIDFLKGYSGDKGDISLSSIGDNPSEFSKFMHAWKIDVDKQINDLEISKLFNDRGNSIMTLVSILSIIVAIILFVVALMFDFGDNGNTIITLSIVLFIESIVVFALPNKIMGRWTKEGKEFHDKWKNFEKYIKDYSLIKEYPPASVQVWGKYLIYATALGCADKVNKNMKKYFKETGVSESTYYNSNAVFFSMYGGHMIMHDTLNRADAPSSDSGSFGDIGDIGGGFGGGGGGVF